MLKNAQTMVERFKEKNVKVISNKTENHMFLIDVKKSFSITGKEAEEVLDKIHITCNKNTIPNETEPPTKASGLRIGTPAMTTRGLKEKDFIIIADIIIDALSNKDDETKLMILKNQVLELTSKYPIYK